ncbi:MAG: hypothetical protein IJH62_09705 [Mogibacterium sp.]|nr:hypothetical protein [Mogibacterium sp.]
MTAITNDVSVKVQMMLNNGTTQTGQLKTVAVSIGKLNLTRFDADKAINIADAVSDVLAKAMSEVRKTTVSRLLSE